MVSKNKEQIEFFSFSKVLHSKTKQKLFSELIKAQKEGELSHEAGTANVFHQKLNIV